MMMFCDDEGGSHVDHTGEETDDLPATQITDDRVLKGTS